MFNNQIRLFFDTCLYILYRHKYVNSSWAWVTNSFCLSKRRFSWIDCLYRKIDISNLYCSYTIFVYLFSSFSLFARVCIVLVCCENNVFKYMKWFNKISSSRSSNEITTDKDFLWNKKKALLAVNLYRANQMSLANKFS